ncbi:MAG: TIGR01244 family phosphatase [Defluviimonas sp.]|uniref:TIGR01244 family sulfur transferase n=1 Tax=Albidovulum sp. TaxID=1872424 RepID=UPI001DA103FC|nr:TIGR01244 family phosphatase [Paracoccaceae bacterium]MCC0064312.1 TIGR01244 family phosphatase [Defluviimonas sp.]
MEIRSLTEDYAVSPQIEPGDVPALVAAGFTTIIDNRPDGEIPGALHTEPMRRAVEAAGLVFVANPVIGGAISDGNVLAQRAAIAGSRGPVLAYCASGNRSSIVWAMAEAGMQPTGSLIDTAARWGYNLEPYRDRIEGFAATR